MRRKIKPAVINRKAIPYSIPFGKRVIPIIPPVYKNKVELKKKRPQPFVEITANELEKFQKDSELILLAGNNPDFPFYNSDLDYIKPAPSAVRLYISPEEFMQIQTRKIPTTNDVYQLDYFETNNDGTPPSLLMIIIAQINSSEIGFKSINLVYASDKLVKIRDDIPKDASDLEFAGRIATLFRYAQIYTRTWTCEDENASTECVVMPFPVIGEPYTYQYPEDLPEL